MQWDQTRQQSELQRLQMALGMRGQDQQLYGQQLGYVTSQQEMANQKAMQEAALANNLQVAYANSPAGQMASMHAMALQNSAGQNIPQGSMGNLMTGTNNIQRSFY
jgi:hypothetical protein